MQVTLNTRIEASLAVELDSHSKATGDSKAAIVAAALQLYFKQQHKPKNKGDK